MNRVFWHRWLLGATAFTAVFGAALLVFPNALQPIFNALFFPSADTNALFSQEAVRYISFIYTIVGAVMIGWSIALWFIITHGLARGEQWAWRALAVSVGAWFIGDTAMSLALGFAPNAVSNSLFLVLYAIPLWALRGGR